MSTVGHKQVWTLSYLHLKGPAVYIDSIALILGPHLNLNYLSSKIQEVHSSRSWNF